MNGRYPHPQGGRIDRGTPVHFTFDGLNYDGVAGDTLASALLANGVHLIGRSFKYHRPRGIMTAGAEEPNALVTVSRGRGRTTPNLRATQIELYDGLEAESQNRWPVLAAGYWRDQQFFFIPAVGWILLQDIHGAARHGQLGLDPDIRACDPPRGRPWRAAALFGP